VHRRDRLHAEGSGEDSEQDGNSNQTSFDVTADDSAISADLSSVSRLILVCLIYQGNVETEIENSAAYRNNGTFRSWGTARTGELTR
jgi:hypothetical protein